MPLGQDEEKKYSRRSTVEPNLQEKLGVRKNWWESCLHYKSLLLLLLVAVVALTVVRTVASDLRLSTELRHAKQWPKDETATTTEDVVPSGISRSTNRKRGDLHSTLDTTTAVMIAPEDQARERSKVEQAQDVVPSGISRTTFRKRGSLHTTLGTTTGVMSASEEIASEEQVGEISKRESAQGVVPTPTVVDGSNALKATGTQSSNSRHGYPYLNIVDLGAIGDGRTDCTQVFKSAITQLQRAGGGTIQVPHGIFRSAPLELTSHMTIFLERGAVLQAINDFALYEVVDPLESYGFGREGTRRGRRVAFLFGKGLQDVVITGNGGEIDGSGGKWWAAKSSRRFDGITVPHLIEIQHTRRLEISHLHLRNSPMWTIHPFACTEVVVKDVEIDNPVEAHNTDGIDPDSCENVLIENVVYKGGDDGIAIKSGWDCFGDERGFNRPTRNVMIRNFTVKNTRAAAVAIGSEMSGGVANVTIDGLRVERAGAGGALCIKTTAARGGYVRNITLQGLELGDVTGAEGQVAGLMIAGKLGGWIPEPNPACRKKERRIPDISRINFRDLQQIPGTRVLGPAVRLEGLEEGQMLQALVLERINLVSSARISAICANARISMRGMVSFTGEPHLTNGAAIDKWNKGVGCTISQE